MSTKTTADDEPRALIVGGSIGGLFAAHFLRSIGWKVLVFESLTDDLAARGAAIGVTEELLQIMQSLELKLNWSAGNVIKAVVAIDRFGHEICRYPRLMVSNAWSGVYRPLRDALQSSCILTGKTFTHSIEDARSVTACFTDGSAFTGDILIGADGIHSAVRKQLMPNARPSYAGYVAWRGIIDERNIPSTDRDLFLNHLTFSFAPREMILCVPMPADFNTQARRACFVWYRSADLQNELPLLCTDARGRRHGISISPSLIRKEIVDGLKLDAHRLFAPAIAGLVEKTERPLLQAIFDLEVPHMAFGRIALLGDAAFVSRPHAIAGVTKAALDAQALARNLQGHEGCISDRLRIYEQERRFFGLEIVSHARRLGAHLQSGAHQTTDDRTPASLLREYRQPYLLHDPVSVFDRSDEPGDVDFIPAIVRI